MATHGGLPAPWPHRDVGSAALTLTVFFRYMLEHGGLVALHEPFDNIADHGSTAVNGHLVSDPAELITTLRGLARTATVFFKELTDRRHHAVLADRQFLTEATHTFLIRAPAEIAASCYALQGPRLTLPRSGLSTLTISTRLLSRPAAPARSSSSTPTTLSPTLPRPWRPTAPRPASRSARRPCAGHPVTAMNGGSSARWHARVSQSTGFTQSPTSYEITTANNAMLARYSAYHEPFDQALRAHKISIC